MPNTNFQTIHQMGGAINSFVKQATGRDNVQNIDMEHITVAQNHYYEDVDISGRVVSFNAGAAGIPLKKCLVQIEPVQDLHGYDHPWPAGGGKNLLDSQIETSGYILGTDGAFVSGVDAWKCSTDYSPILPNTNYILYKYETTVSSAAGYAIYDENKNYIDGNAYNSGAAISITTPQNARYIRASWGRNASTPVALMLSTETDTSFSPYSNICPITGWTKAKVFVSPTTDEADGTTYTIAFPAEAGTVYGGTLDVTTGELVVDRAMVDLGAQDWNYRSNSGSEAFYCSLSGCDFGTENVSICSAYSFRRYLTNLGKLSGLYDGEYAVFTNGNVLYMRNRQYSDADSFAASLAEQTFVYPLATPTTYQLTPQEVRTLLGQNNIWADTGDIEVKFTDIRGLY